MIANPFRCSPVCLIFLAGLSISSASAQTTIFSDDFSGGTGSLNATTPDTTTGAANWVATSTILADGTIGGTGAGTATLAFTPQAGRIYTLSASFTGTSTTATDWILFGFGKGQSTSSSTSAATAYNPNITLNTGENRFLEYATVGVAWMFARASDSRAILGNPAAAGANPGTQGSSTTGSVAWTDGSIGGGSYDLRIVLDTTAPTWTATWFAKAATDVNYSTKRSTANLVSTDITSVGFGKSNTNAVGTIESFSLTSITPTSSSLIHHWKLDSNANDSVSGASYTTGRFGQAVSLDDVNDFISTANAGNAIIPATDYTLMA